MILYKRSDALLKRLGCSSRTYGSGGDVVVVVVIVVVVVVVLCICTGCDSSPLFPLYVAHILTDVALIYSIEQKDV